MKYQKYYYKNLCEQLQDRINILKKFLSEAGLKRTMKSGNPEKLKKEYLRQSARQKAKKKEIRGLVSSYEKSLGSGVPASQTNNLLSSAEAGVESSKQLGSNIEEIGMQLSADYPQQYQQATQIGADRPFPTPSQMASNFFTQGRRTSGSYQY